MRSLDFQPGKHLKETLISCEIYRHLNLCICSAHNILCVYISKHVILGGTLTGFQKEKKGWISKIIIDSFKEKGIDHCFNKVLIILSVNTASTHYVLSK